MMVLTSTPLTELVMSHPPARPGSINVLLGLVILLVFYFLPTVIARARRSTMTVWVVLIDLLAGWTLVGWVVALVMALASSRKPAVTVDVQPATPAGGSSPSSAPR